MVLPLESCKKMGRKIIWVHHVPSYFLTLIWINFWSFHDCSSHFYQKRPWLLFFLFKNRLINKNRAIVHLRPPQSGGPLPRDGSGQLSKCPGVADNLAGTRPATETILWSWSPKKTNKVDAFTLKMFKLQRWNLEWYDIWHIWSYIDILIFTTQRWMIVVGRFLTPLEVWMPPRFRIAASGHCTPSNNWEIRIEQL